MSVAGYDRVLVLDVLERIGTFRHCDKRHLGLIADAVKGRKRLHDGAVLCEAGDDPHTWWVVLEGTADVELDGRKVGSVAKDEAVGELSAFDHQPRSATVIARGDLDVLEFDSTKLLDAIREEPQLGINLLAIAAERLRAADQIH